MCWVSPGVPDIGSFQPHPHDRKALRGGGHGTLHSFSPGKHLRCRWGSAGPVSSEELGSKEHRGRPPMVHVSGEPWRAPGTIRSCCCNQSPVTTSDVFPRKVTALELAHPPLYASLTPWLLKPIPRSGMSFFSFYLSAHACRTQRYSLRGADPVQNTSSACPPNLYISWSLPFCRTPIFLRPSTWFLLFAYIVHFS